MGFLQDIGNIKNYFFDVSSNQKPKDNKSSGFEVKKDAKDLRKYAMRIQLERTRQDIKNWRNAIVEAENGWFPFRTEMQKIYNDTIINGHVIACMEKRKTMVKQKGFEIVDLKGNVNEELTKKIDSFWFYDLISKILDTPAFGYTAINYSGIENDKLYFLGHKNERIQGVYSLRRHLISPDRLNYVQVPNMISGLDLLDETIKDENGNKIVDWLLYIPTPSQTGNSICGYGYLYNVAYYEIFLRNLYGFNADAIELLGVPPRIATTSKTDEEERQNLLNDLANLGSSGVMVIDPQDEIKFLEGSRGTNDLYSSFEERCVKMITKIILGHADAMSNTAGKLSNNGSGDDGVSKAMKEVQVSDSRFCEYVINDLLRPKMKAIGFNILPDGYNFRFKNDLEDKEEQLENIDKANKLAEAFQKIKNAGGVPNWDYFFEKTGIKIEKGEEIEEPNEGDNMNYIRNFYGRN